MANETISVVYHYVGTLPAIGKDVYHGTLVYTNSQNQTFFSGGDRSNQNMTDSEKNSIGNMFDAANAASKGGVSAYGSLITVQGSKSDPALATYAADWLSPSNASTVLASGSNLSAQWATITATMSNIGSQGLVYSPLTQNSNSAWCTAAAAAGLSAPQNSFISGNQWTPACGNILSTPYTPAPVNATPWSVSLDGNGDKVITVSEKSASGVVSDTYMLGYGNMSYMAAAVGSTTPGISVASGAIAVVGQGVSVYASGVGISMANGITASISGSNDTINTGTLGTATVNGNNNQLTGSNASIWLGDGATGNKINETGWSSVHGQYGDFTLVGNTAFNHYDISTTNEVVRAASSNALSFNPGWENTLYDTGGNIADLGFSTSTLTVIGSGNNIDMFGGTLNAYSSNINIFADTSGNGELINGSFNNFSGAGFGPEHVAIDGLYNTGSLPGDVVTYLGQTTGDTIGNPGGSSSWNTDPNYYNCDPTDPFSADPIVLNLSGGKVQTVSLSGSSAYFDVQNNGLKIHTAWGTAGEGYLVYDPSEKNVVNNGSSLVADFGELRNLDSNHDGKLNSLDNAWAHLKVWVDTAGIASFSSGSLKTMSQIGIASINLGVTHVNQLSNFNTILDDSTFTWASGGTGDIASVAFNYDPNTLKPVTNPRGGGGGGACVHVSSMLPDGTQAGDVKVGEAMLLADEKTLAPGAGVVSYSARKTAEGYRIKTKSGASLVCSDTAPIPTPEGLVLAPNLAGKRVAVRKDEAGSSLVMWDDVTSVEHVGIIDIQHITVGNKCFWAGEKKDLFILHHNLKQIP